LGWNNFVPRSTDKFSRKNLTRRMAELMNETVQNK